MCSPPVATRPPPEGARNELGAARRSSNMRSPPVASRTPPAGAAMSLGRPGAHRVALIDICASADLLSGGRGVRFEVDVGGRNAPAFAIRYGGRAFAYLNRCAHVAMELDWQPGVFFDFDAEYLLCSTHGAFYDPATGTCRGGACTGHGGLRALNVIEQDGRVLWQPDGYAEPVHQVI